MTADDEKTGNELRVFIAHRESVCGECGESLDTKAWILLAGERGALCLACADMDHLVFLPAGNAALTRRAKNTRPSMPSCSSGVRRASVMNGRDCWWTRPRWPGPKQSASPMKRRRSLKRQRSALRRAEIDEQFEAAFAGRVRELFPGCPPGRECTIAEHACLKYSGRVGRSAAAMQLDETAVRLAVIAHLRHVETNYDALLGRGEDRDTARQLVQAEVERKLRLWINPTRS